MLENSDTIIIGHNLDDYIEVPGMIMINKRNVTKKNIKYLSFNSFDFNCDTPIKLIDIHSNISGECSENFINYTSELNKKYAKSMWKSVNFGFLGNIFVKPFAVWFWAPRMHKYTQYFSCKST